MSKNVSDNFKNIIKTGGAFYAYAKVTLSNGSTFELDSKNNFMSTGNGYSEGSESGFPLGSAISKSIRITIDNALVAEELLQDITNENIQDTTGDNISTLIQKFSADLYNARIVLYTEVDIPNGTQERVQEGIFTVVDSVYPGEVIEITAYDDMYKADQEFVSKLTYPVSAQMLLNEVCDYCDITLGSASFKNNDFQIQQPPNKLTGRQIIGYIAQIAVGNAYVDYNGRLQIKSYALSEIEEEIDPNDIETESGKHIISQYTSDPTISVEDVIITGVSTTIESEDYSKEDETYLVGSEDYAIKIDNPLISGNEKEAVDLISDVIIGMKFRPFSGTFIPNPTIEFMDECYLVDRKDNVYYSFVTLHDFDYLGNSMIANETDPPQKYNGTYYSEASEAYQKAKKGIEINKNQWEQAIENLSQQVANASGLYTTEEEQPDGSTIFYMHNKPTLEESDIVWKMTAETLTVSTDGGHSWNAGITVNGEVIARIMNTIGINFDWGVGGTLIIQDEEGNQTAYIDADTGTVRLAVESLTITGKTVQEIASEQSDETLNNFVDSVYNPAIGNLQAQIDGQIETYYYDYEPTLNNEPASEWTTEEERRNHEGDLFYWKSKGYAYRFFKDGDTWKWQMVQDTDITKALEEAADAKDTADQKRRVFVTQPYPPYDVGDLWVGDDTSEMMRCQRARSSGSYVASDWIKAVKYTDDSELYNFVQNDYNETIKDIYNSVDQKSETWYQATDPALEWTEIESTPLQDTTGANILDTVGETIITIWEKEKSLHNGDLWKNSATNVEYIYQNGEWVEMPIPDEVFDMIDGKAQIFVVQPTPPYAVGDVWFTGTTILVCDTARESGEFNANDWTKRDNYTDDSALYEFIEGDYASTIDELQTQSDKKAETWYQANDPSTHWNADEKLKHDGDLWYNTSSQKTYIYNGSAWEETKSNPPDEVFDTIDGKAQIFVRQPVPPYAVGDLWFDSASSDIMTCIYSRESGNFNAGDWQKRNKYTDDSYAEEVAGDLSNFADQVVGDLENMQTQIDGKIETYYYDYQPTLTNIPASAWTTETERQKHIGDLFYHKSTGFTYRFLKDGSTWKWQPIKDEDISKALSDAAEAQDTADSKRRVFTSTPTPPYDVGDLWAQGGSGDIMRCIRSRSSGNYTSSDWDKASKYTDDSALYEFIEGDYSETVENLKNQADKKAETWYQSTDPSTGWTAAEKAGHTGDLWYNTAGQKTYIYNGTGWEETKSTPPDEVFDEIDGKARIFVTTPVPPYSERDLWMQGPDGDIMTCVHGRESGSFVSSDWEVKQKYTDDTAAIELDESLNQEGVFNRLTNNGEVQGLFLINGQLYVNASYIKSGIFAVSKPGGTQTFYANTETGVVRIIADEFSLTNGDTIDSIAEDYANSAYENSVQYTEQQLQDYEPNLTQESVFNALTNNGQAQGIFIRNGQLYINMSYAQSGTLKLGGSNNINGLLQVYNSSGVLVGTIDNIGAKFTNGSDWLQISQSLLTGGYGSTTDGLLDLSANYSTGRHVVLESKTGDVILKSSDEFRVQRQSGGMGYLVQSGGTDYFDDIEVSFGDTYPIIGIMYGADEQGYNPFLDIRLANGKSVYFSGGTPPSIADSFLVRQVSAAVTQSHGYGARLISLSYSGYKALGVVGYSTSSTYHAMYQMNFNSSAQTVTVGIRHVNDTSASGNINVYLQVLYVKS